jgi:hypothetical protein
VKGSGLQREKGNKVHEVGEKKNEDIEKRSEICNQ